MKIALIIFDRFTDLDLFLPWDLLNRVRLVGGMNDWEVRILGTQPHHLSDAGLLTPTSGMVEEAGGADAVLFASGRLVPELVQDASYLQRFSLNPDRQLIGAMCSGSIVLAALGLLEGIEATTYPTRKKLLAEYGVKVVDRSFVPHGSIATAAGCLAAQDLSAWVIRSLAGEEMAAKVLESVQPVGV